jgi:zinc protease
MIPLAPPAVPPYPKRAIYIVDKPGAPQTSLAVATIGAPRSTPDYVPLEVMNMVFGGQFSSRINMNLREEHGYTYGAHSSFAFRRGAGPFSASAGIRTDATAPAVQELFREVERIRNTELSAEELKVAKDAWALSLAGDFETTADIAETEGGLFVYGLPSDYYGGLSKLINAVTATDVQRVAKEALHPESMVVIAVGDRARIAPELEKLNLGPVQLVP